MLLFALRLREALRARLPEHLVPAAFVLLPALPLSPNGKVDRQALAKIEPELSAVSEHVAPRGPVEEALAAIWEEVLSRSGIGAEDSFFDVLASHGSQKLLSEVFEAGTPEAKTYALCGLHYIAPRRFEHYAEGFAAAKIKVQTLSGCIGGERASAEVVSALRSNLFERYLPVRKEIEDHRRTYEREKRR